MALSTKDADLIAARLELLLEKRLTRHLDRDHTPIWTRLSKMNVKLAYIFGGLVVINVAIQVLIKLWSH